MSTLNDLARLHKENSVVPVSVLLEILRENAIRADTDIPNWFRDVLSGIAGKQEFERAYSETNPDFENALLELASRGQWNVCDQGEDMQISFPECGVEVTLFRELADGIAVRLTVR